MLGPAILERLRRGDETAAEVVVLTGASAAHTSGGAEMVPAARLPELVPAVYRLHGTRTRFMRLPTLHDGRRVLVRAVRPADAARLKAFDEGLSTRSRQLRYMGTKPPMTED